MAPPTFKETKEISLESSIGVRKWQPKYFLEAENGVLHCTMFENFPGKHVPQAPPPPPLKSLM